MLKLNRNHHTVHPQVRFEKVLEVGQLVEARFLQGNYLCSILGRVVKIDRKSVRVEAVYNEPLNGKLKRGEQVTVPLLMGRDGQWSNDRGVFPYVVKNGVEHRKLYHA